MLALSPTSEMLWTLLGCAGWFILILFPGLWVTFSFRTASMPFGMKLIGGVVLSPLVVIVQFYILRFAGISFETTACILPIINLPAAYLVFRNAGGVPRPDKEDFLLICLATVLVVVSLAPHLASVQSRMLTGHTLTHVDIVTQLRNGVLRPEEPELAQVKLAYPWGGHVFQAVLCFITNSSPASSYIWTNIFWALAMGIGASYLVRELGGNRFARLTAPVWLYFGLNWAGYVLQKILPAAITSRFWIGGDYRYTPWILKFYFFEQVIFGLGMTAVLLYVLLRSQSFHNDRLLILLKFLLLVGIGIIYPILIAPAFLIIGSSILVDRLSLTDEARPSGFLGRNTTDLLILAGVGLITVISLKFVTVDRVTPAIKWPSLTKNFVAYTFLKALGSVIAVSLFAGAYTYVRSRPMTGVLRASILLLGICSALILFLNIVVELPFYGNEYKFIMVVALCLAPFPALALNRLGTWSTPSQLICFLLLTTTLSLPLFHKLISDYPWYPPKEHGSEVIVPWPAISTDGFRLKLDTGVEVSAMCEAIRQATPLNAVTVMEATEIHLPSFTQRTLFVSPDFDGKRPGVNLSSSELLTDVRGYDEGTFNERKKILHTLYQSRNPDEIRESIKAVQSLRRPVAIILNVDKDTGLRDALSEIGGSQTIYSAGSKAVWLLPVGPQSD